MPVVDELDVDTGLGIGANTRSCLRYSTRSSTEKTSST